MTDFETIARQRLVLAVDNTHRRQTPYPTPWYERYTFLAALLVAVAAWPVIVILLGWE